MKQKMNSSNSSSEMHEHWEGEKHKPREVMTTRWQPGRSRGVYATYVEFANGKRYRDER